MKALASVLFAFTVLMCLTSTARALCDSTVADQERHRAENAARVKDYPLAHAEGKAAGLDFEDCRDGTSDPAIKAKANLLAGFSFAIAAVAIHRYGDQEGDAEALARESRRDLRSYLSSNSTDSEGRSTAKNWLKGLDAEGL
jgi:hypothetical protein